MKDQLQKPNVQTELVASEPKNTNILEHYLLEIDKEESDPERLDQTSERAVQMTKK
jgi:hypothetical protein